MQVYIYLFICIFTYAAHTHEEIVIQKVAKVPRISWQKSVLI